VWSLLLFGLCKPLSSVPSVHGKPFTVAQPVYSNSKRDFAFNEIQAVMNQFAAGDYEKDVLLNGSYLIGLLHERAYIDSLIKAAAEKKKNNQPLSTNQEV
jgi:hypothetical protein